MSEKIIICMICPFSSFLSPLRVVQWVRERGIFMFLNTDIRVTGVDAIIKKVEPPTFYYECKGRGGSGFVFVLDGTGTFRDSTGQYPLKKHSIMIVPKGYQYSVKAGPNGLSYITTGFGLCPETAYQDLNLPTCVSLEKHPYLLRQAEEMLKIWETRDDWYLTECRIRMDRFLLDLIKAIGSTEPFFQPNSKLSPALRHISQNYDKPITNEHLAGLCNLSQTHFRRLFSQLTGQSPLQYRESVRIHWAVKFLQTQMFTVTEIAGQLGYADVYHFSKAFKKATGHSPSDFKNQGE